jgi:hypothetical protein
MRHLFVNGTHVVRDGELVADAVAARPGELLRPAVR